MSASAVLMIEPLGFAPNPTTADDNAFQTDEGYDEDTEALAREEFKTVVAALTDAGVEAHVFPGDPTTPDATFPNNWFSTHEDGKLVLYPMRSEIRRLERRHDIVAWLKGRYPDLIDLTSREERGAYLEGTGSMVLDRANKTAYIALSTRTSESTARFWCQRMGYEPVIFETEDGAGHPIYHTNVLLALGTTWAVVCSECILRPAPVLSSLLASGRELIEITTSQMGSFCGNLIELCPPPQSDLSLRRGVGGWSQQEFADTNRPIILMSTTAHDAFTENQRAQLANHGRILALSIPTIERFGGGGIRCMIAELC